MLLTQPICGFLFHGCGWGGATEVALGESLRTMLNPIFPLMVYGAVGFIEMGPQMLSGNYLNITYTIVWLLAFANVVGTLLCIVSSGAIAQLTNIRFTLLAPFLFMLIAFAAFQSSQSLGDLVSLFALGLVGIFLKRFDWSRPAFLIGFVLSNPTETFANQAYQIAESKFQQGLGVGLEYLFSPIVLGLMGVTIASVVIGLKQTQAIRSEGEAEAGSKKAPVIFLLVLLVYLGVSGWNASQISDRLLTDKIFPLLVAGVSIVACLYLLLQMRLRPKTDMLFADNERSKNPPPHGLWATLAWFGGLLFLSSLLGFIAALTVFLIAFFIVRAGLRLQQVLVFSFCGILMICLLALLLNRDFPPGLLQDFFNLPWPLGSDKGWFR